MPRAREIARQRARAYRIAKAKAAQEAERLRRGGLSRVLSTARAIVADEHFAEVARQQGTRHVPNRLVAGAESLGTGSEAQEVLDFIVAWKFFFPSFHVEAMRSYLDRSWPGFVDELKDTFIGLVMQGPFVGARRPSISRDFFN
jgi:hypothetical protein